MSPEEIKAAYPVGTMLKMKPEMVDGYLKRLHPMLNKRTAVVSGYSFPNGYPVVKFPPQGRFRGYAMRLSERTFNHWERVTS